MCGDSLNSVEPASFLTPVFHTLHPHLSHFILLIHIMAQSFQNGAQSISDSMFHKGDDADLSDQSNSGHAELAVTQLDPW